KPVLKVFNSRDAKKSFTSGVPSSSDLICQLEGLFCVIKVVKLPRRAVAKSLFPQQPFWQLVIKIRWISSNPNFTNRFGARDDDDLSDLGEVHFSDD
ncbi:10038_t:CDS:2, partial [Paraglomus occultum]